SNGLGRITLGNNSTLQVSGGQDAYFLIRDGFGGAGYNATHTIAGTTGGEYLETQLSLMSNTSWVIDNVHWLSNDNIILNAGNTLTVNANASALLGTLDLEDGALATINGNLMNYDAASHTLGNINLTLSGSGTFKFNGAGVQQMNGFLILN